MSRLAEVVELNLTPTLKGDVTEEVRAQIRAGFADIELRDDVKRRIVITRLAGAMRLSRAAFIASCGVLRHELWWLGVMREGDSIAYLQGQAPDNDHHTLIAVYEESCDSHKRSRAVQYLRKRRTVR